MQSSFAGAAIALGALAGFAAADFKEGFEGTMPGWDTKNVSSPATERTWEVTDGVERETFGAHKGTKYAFAADDHTGQHGTISSWLFSPVTVVNNADKISFWTRTIAGSPFPDRMQVLFSANGASTNTGPDEFSVGDFTTVVADINFDFQVGGFPDQDWQQITALVLGLNGPVTGRFAFRYFVPGGGSAAERSNYIGLDDVAFFNAAVPTPGVLGLFGAGAAVGARRRRR